MTILQILTAIFIGWEILHVFICSSLWKSILRQWELKINNEGYGMITIYNNIILKYFSYMNILFLVVLFFTQWWWVSLSIFGVTSVATITLFPLVKNMVKFNFKIFFIFLISAVTNIGLLSQIFNPLEFLK